MIAAAVVTVAAIITTWIVHDLQAWCERHDYQTHRED